MGDAEGQGAWEGRLPWLLGGLAHCRKGAGFFCKGEVRPVLSSLHQQETVESSNHLLFLAWESPLLGLGQVHSLL